VLGDREYERVSGSSIGGGTFWGLCSLLTGVDTFGELLELSAQGDNRRVDMLVGDIYGKGRDYGKIGLSTDTIASSFGKAIMKKTGEDIPEFTKADMAKSLLFMICNNIGQIAYLNAVRFGLKRIYFAGYFIRDHPTTMRSLSYAVNFWSKGEAQALFLKHEGYLGSLGAFLEPEIQEVTANSPPTSPSK
jgi:type II pantothenate kinase